MATPSNFVDTQSFHIRTSCNVNDLRKLFNGSRRAQSDLHKRRETEDINVTNRDWYILRVRPGFEAVVAQRLREFELEVFVPERNATSSQGRQHEQGRPAGYI